MVSDCVRWDVCWQNCCCGMCWAACSISHSVKWEMTLRMLIRWLDCSLRMCWGGKAPCFSVLLQLLCLLIG